LLVNGEVGTAFCSREGGAWTDAATSCNAVHVADTVNTGTVKEGDVTNDIKSDNALAGLVVVVTVITQATPNQDGTAHFQTFIDVTGGAEPTADQQKAICDAIKTSLATHLGVDAGTVKCELTKKGNKRQTGVTTQYVADLTVGTPASNVQSGAASVVPVLALAAAALAAF